MNAIHKISILLLIISALWSCSKNNSQPLTSTDEHALIYQELLSMEYALLIDDYDLLTQHAESLDVLLKDSYNLFCPEESAQIDGARMTNQILVQHIDVESSATLLDDLRILKGTIINLVSDDEYDPFFAFLWRFEEDMYNTTEVAMDPMLDLYEWNEFEALAECMNDSWQPLKLHRPSAEILDYDPDKFKNQSIYKIYLEKAVEDFNQAVRSADYQQYPLCDVSEEVRKAYVAYIKSFIKGKVESDTFLAKL